MICGTYGVFQSDNQGFTKNVLRLCNLANLGMSVKYVLVPPLKPIQIPRRPIELTMPLSAPAQTSNH